MPRAPQPAKLRLLNGARPDKVNLDEPIASSKLPEAPDDLPPDVLEVWEYTLAEIDTMGLASSADRDLLVCYCEAVVGHRKASADVADRGLLIVGQLGGVVRNPSVAQQRDYAAQIKTLAHEFGLSPSARAGIKVEKGGEGDENPFGQQIGGGA